MVEVDKKNSNNSAPYLEILGLFSSYGRNDVLHDISFSAAPGETIGIIGPNGAGKTTLFETIQGFKKFKHGTISLFGKSILPELSVEVKQRIGIAPQFFSLPFRLTVNEIIQVYHSIYNSNLNVSEVIQQVGLTHQKNIRFGRLSGGQQRRLAIAIALIGDPDLIFLDEPTGDLDPQSRRFIWDIIQNKSKSKRRTVIIATHQMDEVEALCDRVIIIDNGRIIEDGNPSDIIRKHCPQQRIEFIVCDELAEQLNDSFMNMILTRTDRMDSSILVKIETTNIKEELQRLIFFSNRTNCVLTDLKIRLGTLEDVFFILTGKELRD